MDLGVIDFRVMERAAKVVLWLAVIVGMLFPMVAPNGMAHAEIVMHDHGGSHHEATHAHGVDCESSDCAEMPAWQGCHDGAIHCVTALVTPAAYVHLLRLPRDADHPSYAILAAPHGAPETEVPPPRS